MIQLLVGLGSGRCGTKSLATLLSKQPGWDCVHERKPFLSWDNDPQPDRHFQGLKKNTADVGFYYLPYVPYLAEKYPQMRFICLKRPRQDTIDSFIRWLPPGQNWFARQPAELNEWDRAFPKYDDMSFEEAVGRYWDEYYDRAEGLRRQLTDRFRIWPTDALNRESGVRHILYFAGVLAPHANVVTGIKVNCAKG